MSIKSSEITSSKIIYLKDGFRCIALNIVPVDDNLNDPVPNLNKR